MSRNRNHISLFDLTGRIALITGSSHGLGFTLAVGLGQAGAYVILNGRDEKRLKQAFQRLTRSGILAQKCVFDITDSQSIGGQV